jgi:hypothetical protein
MKKPNHAMQLFKSAPAPVAVFWSAVLTRTTSGASWSSASPTLAGADSVQTKISRHGPMLPYSELTKAA